MDNRWKAASGREAPVGEELTLREITAPDGYEIAEDVKFTLEDTMEIQKVEMKDARTPETTVPKQEMILETAGTADHLYCIGRGVAWYSNV